MSEAIGYVLVSAQVVKNSLEARKTVAAQRSDDGSLSIMRKRESEEVCSSFWIGGKATEKLWPAANNCSSNYHHSISVEGLLDTWHIPSDEHILDLRQSLNNLWRNMGGKSGNPRTRKLQPFGYEDDAQLMNEHLAWFCEELREFGGNSQRSESLPQCKVP
ncbi:MAG: hypothetical protein R2867_37520 [Caldilineaceae bacterium]